jgi:transposase
MTSMLYLAICRELSTVHSLNDIARDNCVTESIVMSVLQSVDFALPDRLPETLCIDEFHGSTGVYNPARKRWDVSEMHCNVADGDAGCVVDILPSITLDQLTPYFFSFSLEARQRVRFFACDMHGGFITLAKRCFPNVTVCIDMFHVVKLLNKNITTLRVRLQDMLLESGDQKSYRLVKHSARLLLTAACNQEQLWKEHTAQNRARVEAVLSLSQDLREAYDALQAFHNLLRTDSYRLQRIAFSDWLGTYSSSECGSTRKAANTLRHHRQYIQNSWKYHKSNATCEGLNKKIKDIKRNASGLHDFQNFRKRILFACGYTAFVKESYTLFSEKRSAGSTCKGGVDHDANC